MPAKRYKLALALMLSVLVGATGVVVVLLKMLGNSFADIHTGRIFPLGERVDYTTIGAANTPAPGGACVAFYGDSRAYHWAKYVDSNTDVSIANLAEGGRTTAQQLLLLPFAETSGEKYPMAVLQVGINDLHPLGALSEMQRRKARENTKTHIAEIVRRLTLQAETVVVTTVFPPGPTPLSRAPFWDDATLTYIRELNAQIRAIDGVVVMESGNVLAQPENTDLIRSGFLADDFYLHVNEAAYSALTRVLADSGVAACVAESL
ncbi:MAG: SGNH/GDSL hydrolase family protein [Pseudomonadota bacterium]